MSAHTTWRSEAGYNCQIIFSGDRDLIGKLTRCSPDNLRLILAAPQLLEACKAAIGVFRPRDGASEDESQWFYSVIVKCPEVRALYAAIAAATGETT